MSGIAHTTAAALTHQGFHVTEIGDASTQLRADSSSEILYGPSGTEAAHTLASALSGPVTLVADPSLSGQTVQLLDRRVAVDRDGAVDRNHHHHDDDVADRAGHGTTTTTTIPSDVYTNTQPEPWNPFPCTLGQPTPTTSTRTTKQAVTKK